MKKDRTPCGRPHAHVRWKKRGHGLSWEGVCEGRARVKEGGHDSLVREKRLTDVREVRVYLPLCSVVGCSWSEERSSFQSL